MPAMSCEFQHPDGNRGCPVDLLAQAEGCKHPLSRLGIVPTPRSCDASKGQGGSAASVTVPCAEASQSPRSAELCGSEPVLDGRAAHHALSTRLPRAWAAGPMRSPRAERGPPPGSSGAVLTMGLVGAGPPDAHRQLTGWRRRQGQCRSPGPRPTGRAVFIQQRSGQEGKPSSVTFRRGRTTDKEVATSLRGLAPDSRQHKTPWGARGTRSSPCQRKGS